MNKINFTVVLKTLFVVWLLPFLYHVIFSDLASSDIQDVKVAPYELKVLDTQSNTLLDNKETVKLFESLGPSKAKDEGSEAAKKVVKKVIDKTLLPNFKRFDDKNQVGLAAIFNEEVSFVVVELKNYETQKSRFERVALGQNLGQYQLTKIVGDAAEFTKNTEQLTLQLFKTN